MLHARLDNDSAAIQLRSLPPPPPAAEAANAPTLQPLQGRHEPAYHPQLAGLVPAPAAQRPDRGRTMPFPWRAVCSTRRQV